MADIRLSPYGSPMPATLGPTNDDKDSVPVPGPVSLPKPQAKPLIPSKIARAYQEAGKAGQRPLNSYGTGGLGGGGQMQRKAEDFTGDMYSFSGGGAVTVPPLRSFRSGGIVSFDGGGEITGEDTTALWNQQEEDEKRRQAALLAGPPPTAPVAPAGPAQFGPGATAFNNYPPMTAPKIGDLAPPPASASEPTTQQKVATEAANTWTPAQIVNMVQQAKDSGLYEKVAPILPAIVDAYTQKQQGPSNLERVQQVLGPGIGGAAVKGAVDAANYVGNRPLGYAGGPSIYDVRNAANEAVFQPYVVPASNLLAEAGGQAVKALNVTQAAGTPNGQGYNPEAAQAAGEAIGGNILPTTPEAALAQGIFVGKGASLAERLDPIGITSLFSPAEKAAATGAKVLEDVPIPSRGQPAFGPGSRGAMPADTAFADAVARGKDVPLEQQWVPKPPDVAEANQVYRLGVDPAALKDVPAANEFAASQGSKQIADPAGVRVLQPGEALKPGEVEMFHGGRLEGPIQPDMFVTPNERSAGVIARFNDRAEGAGLTSPPTGGGSTPVPTPAEPISSAAIGSPPPASPELSPMMQQVERARAEAGALPPGPAYSGPPPSYPAGPPGTMGEQFPEVAGTMQHNTQNNLVRVNPESPASRMGAPEAYNPANFPPTPQAQAADTAMREAGIRPEVGQLQPPGTGAALRASDIANSETLTDAQRQFLGSPNGHAAAAQRDADIMANAAPEALRQEASRVAPELGISDSRAAEILKNWEGNARLTQDTGNPTGIARIAASLERPVEGGITGNYTDSFLTGLAQRRTDLEQTLARGTSMTPEQIRQTVDDAVEGRLINHFDRNPQGMAQARQQLAQDEARAQELAKDFHGLNTFVDRTKNTMFPLDIGFFGQNVLTGMRQGGITTIAGMANRVALAMHMPFATNLEAATGLPRILAASNDGLKLGNIASGLKPDEGTLLRYIPGISAIDKHAITPMLGKLTDAQYTGVGGFLKMMNYEGNLMVLGAAGKDISNPAVRREAARITNNAWSSANLATTPGRGQAEKLAFTSPAFTRSQVAVGNDMLKLITPGASSTQRILAGTAILSNIAFAAGVYKFLNDQLGVGPAQLNPLQPGFGTITLPTKNSEGQNHVINLFPQRTFQTFATRAINAVGNQDPQALVKALAQLGAGRAGALPAAGGRAFGYGYDSNGKFHMGGMDIEERVKASLPVPTSLQNQVLGSGATDPLTTGLQVLGLPNYGSYPGQAAISARSADRNEVLQGPNREQALGPFAPLVGRDEKYGELGSREKEAVNATLSPEQLKAYRDEAVKAGNKSEIAQQQREDIKTGYQPAFQKLEQALKDGSMSPYDVRLLVSATERQMYEKMNAVKYPEASGDYKPSPIQKAESGYRAIYDAMPKGANGKPDYEQVQEAQRAYLAAIGKQDPQFMARLAANVQPRVSPNDSKAQQFYDSPEMKAAAAGYFALAPDDAEGKHAYKVADPAREALLYAGGHTQTLATPAAVEAYKQYSEGQPTINFNVGFRQEGYQTYRQMESGPMGKEVKAYQALPSEQKDDYLRANPDLNAALWSHGHTSHIYSMDAYEKVTGSKQGAGLTVPTSSVPAAATSSPPPAGVQRSSVPVPSPAPPPQQSVAPITTGAPRTLPPVAPGEFNSAQASPQQRQNFIAAMTGPANDYAYTKIPPAVFAAIGASESNYGRAPSIFGIKGVGTAGGADLATHEVLNGQKVNMNDQFAAYNNLDDAFNHFIDLTSHGRYANAWNELQQTGDWQGFLRGITAAGYATDKNWPDSIISLTRDIERNYPQINRR